MTDDTPMKSLRGRPPSAVPKDKFHISIDASVGLFYRSLFFDELSGRMKQGPFSELVERLLREHKEQLQRNFQQQQQSNNPEGEPRD